MKFNIGVAVALALATLVSGCVQTVALQTQFNNADFEFANKPGKATITGQAFMRRNDGIVVYAAGSPVFLLPQTAYTMELYNRSQTAPFGINVSNADARLKNYTRHTTANGEGRFTFSGVPDGAYIVVTGVTWMAGDMRQGGDLTQLVNVSNGQNADLIISR